jgi:hypothetical protein
VWPCSSWDTGETRRDACGGGGGGGVRETCFKRYKCTCVMMRE